MLVDLACNVHIQTNAWLITFIPSDVTFDTALKPDFPQLDKVPF